MARCTYWERALTLTVKIQLVQAKMFLSGNVKLLERQNVGVQETDELKIF